MPEGTVIGCFVTLGAACASLTEPAKKKGRKPTCELGGKGTAHVLIGDAAGELTCYDKTFTWQPEGWLARQMPRGPACMPLPSGSSAAKAGAAAGRLRSRQAPS